MTTPPGKWDKFLVKKPTAVQRAAGPPPAGRPGDDECPPVDSNGLHNLQPFGKIPPYSRKHLIEDNIRPQLDTEQMIELFKHIAVLDDWLAKHPKIVKVPEGKWFMPVINEWALMGRRCFFRSFSCDDETLTTDNELIPSPILTHADERSWRRKVQRIRPYDIERFDKKYDVPKKVVEKLIGRPLWLVLTENVDDSRSMTDEEIEQAIRSRNRNELARALATMPTDSPRLDAVWDAMFSSGEIALAEDAGPDAKREAQPS